MLGSDAQRTLNNKFTGQNRCVCNGYFDHTRKKYHNLHYLVFIHALMVFVAWMKRSGIRDARPLNQNRDPGFRQAASGLRGNN